MDINNLQARLDRIHYAKNSRIDVDFRKYIKVTPLEKGVQVKLPGNVDPIKMENDILSILHTMATMKDHLKSQLHLRGQDKRIVENIIEGSLHLKVLMDLVNADKHTYPTTSNRSGKNPVIKEMSYTLIDNSHGTQLVVATIGPQGEFDIAQGPPPSVALFANIFDEHGNYLFSFDELVEKTYAIWLRIATDYNLI